MWKNGSAASDASPSVTRMLNLIRGGETPASVELLTVTEIRQIAAAKMAREQPGQPLKARASVHEAWIRLGNDLFESRAHLFSAATEALRRIDSRNLFEPWRFRCVMVGFMVALVSGNTAHGTDKTWDGGGNDDGWMAGPNWDAEIAPGINDALFFGGSIRLGSVNNYVAGSLFNGITFNAGAGSFTLSGTALTVSPGISAGAGAISGGSITNNSSNEQTIALPITLSAGNHTIGTAAASGALKLNGAFQRSPGGTAVFEKGGGNINFSLSGLTNDATDSGGLLGGWAIIGPDFAALDASKNVVAYKGYTGVDPGSAIASREAQNVKIPSSGDNVSLMSAGTTEINTLIFSGTTANQTVEVGVGNVLRLGAQGGIYNAAQATGTGRQLIVGASVAEGGTLTAGGADNRSGEITFIDSNITSTSPNNLTINSRIADNGGSNFPVRVNVLGYVAFGDVANSYSGGTFVNQGRFRAANAGSFGSGPVTVYPGAEAFLVNAGTWVNNFFVSGLGPTEVDGEIIGPGAIRLNNTANIGGTVTLQGSARISTSSGGNLPQISGQITGSGSLEICTFARTDSNIMLSNSSAINPNNWTGDLTISSLGSSRQVTVKLGANEQIPDTAGVTIFGIDVARLDLNGFSETIGGLAAPASTNCQITNTGTSPSTLTVGSNNGTGVYAGTIQDGGVSNAIALFKIGTGTQTLAGANSYSGPTMVAAGVLIVGNGAGGSLDGTASVTVASSATLGGSGNIKVSSGNVTFGTGATLAPGN
jgi:autotransporter-associated beta strand protein